MFVQIKTDQTNNQLQKKFKQVWAKLCGVVGQKDERAEPLKKIVFNGMVI